MEDPRRSIADLRREYRHASLTVADADPDPFRQFDRWLEAALESQLTDPNAMILATATPDGRPTARVVLLKGIDTQGFVFYTNYGSRKAAELAANPRAALVFYWAELERQVAAAGTVHRLRADESEAYFATRPRDAQLAAWASRQSEPLASRAELERTFAEALERFRDGPVPRPDFWGGYRLTPDEVEFWQGRPSRLHDRICYTRRPDGGWDVIRLSP